MKLMNIKMKILIFAMLIASLMLSGCGNTAPSSNKGSTEKEIITEEATTEDPEVKRERELNEKVEEIVSSMSLEEKVYQMFIITPEALTDGICITKADDVFAEYYDQYPVGGIIYFAQNIKDPDQIKTLTEATMDASMKRSGLMLFEGVDEEGGLVVRIADQSAFSVPQVGKMRDVFDEESAYQVGSDLGSYLSEYGFNLDFAPDADVITNPNNEVIGSRSFGTDKDDVTKKAIAVSNGLHENHVMSTFKHFPGHGATEGDTHEGFAYTSKSYEELEEEEMVPFKAAQEAGVDCIMVAHISVPNVVGDNTPCSLSDKMVTEILREELGYEGLVVTDALNMGAIVNTYSTEKAAVMAVEAGDDLLLCPDDFHAASDAIIEAVHSGDLDEALIDKAVRRIVRAKLIWMRDEVDG